MADIDVSINNYGQNMNTVPIILSPSTGDYVSAQALADQLGSILGKVNGLLQSGLVYHMVLMARRLSVLNPAIQPDNDTAGMSIVFAGLAQHLLTIGAWNMTASADPTVKTTSYPVKWQVYGSGPRLAWEWASVVILAVILLALAVGGYITMSEKVEAAPWLDVGGMMLAANEAEKMTSVRGSVAGVPSQKAKEATYYVRVLGNGSVQLTDEISGKSKLTRDEEFMNEGHKILVSWSLNRAALARPFHSIKAFFRFIWSEIKQSLRKGPRKP